MAELQLIREDIVLLGSNTLIQEENLCKYMYKTLNWSMKVKKGINTDFLKRNIHSKELIYHPIWLAKLLVIADRKPFKPKKIPMMCFVDAVSGYRGLLTTVPKTTDHPIGSTKVIAPRIDKSEEVQKYIKDIQHTQINRSYVLKKPEHKIVEKFLVHLPIWKVQVEEGSFKKVFMINANTGESEEYMSDQWKTEKWINNRKVR
ncbi:hypothetical protein QGM71_15015 [Virgibacillus sp. C22-A2]|uniref:Uncharacterized protein n=1 Tax=Virgibacillus tibetensis TaxID=3042313 RepID=A0ABU6KHW3_9BACI|nr:hypothetical protein [Virgibacillus sp. C22-A2]